MKVLLVVALLAFSAVAAAKDELPLNEHGFVNAVKAMKIAKIAELLGEPQKHYDLKDERNGQVIGQVWLYEYLNTTEEGEYYPATELDIVDDHVATVVFMNDPQGLQSYTPAPMEEEAEAVLPEIPESF
jgi:hypothetical protein